MVRLSDIPEDTLKEIEEFVKKMKKKVPVTSAPKPDGTRIKTLVDLVEEKFGYRLSPNQIYTLQKGEKVYRVKLPVDVIRDLEERYGSVAKGIKKLLKFYEGSRLPPHLDKAHRLLRQKGELLEPHEIEEALLPLVKESREVWDIVSELARRGYIFRDKSGKFIVSEFPRNPLLEFALGGYG